MIDFIYHLFAFLFAIGILITFHEFGHFWVARKFDVKILRFSIGFGNPLWICHFGKDKSELVVAALPLGGYVKMLDEREGDVKPEELNRSFNRKPLVQRVAIVLAGPAFNFIFAIFAYWLMFIIGLAGLKPIIGEVKPGSIASFAGLQPDQEIIAVESRKTATWSMVAEALIDKVIDGKSVQVTVRDLNDIEKDIFIELNTVSIDDLAETGLLEKLGIEPKQITVPAIIGSVQPGYAAEQAGLKEGDHLLSANGQPITDWVSWVKYIQKHPGHELRIEFMRGDVLENVVLVPGKKTTDDGKVIGYIGAANQPPTDMFARESYSLIPAFLKALERTWDMSWLTLRVLGKMLTGQASYKNLSGPISIAQYAGDSARSGLAAFLWFLGIVSVSLGVLNLLPIPLLDGGHLMYYFIEMFKGSPVSESFQIIGQQIGIALLLCLMVLVFYNDIARLLG